jgi:DNA-directed RNA polymerase sigma subunit (sigma70/sigma32)
MNEWSEWPGSHADDGTEVYLSEIERIAPISDRDRDELVARAARGDEDAVQRLTEAHLPLVVEVARDRGFHGVRPLDVLQAGNLGLVRAVQGLRVDGAPDRAFRDVATDAIRRAIDELHSQG